MHAYVKNEEKPEVAIKTKDGTITDVMSMFKHHTDFWNENRKCGDDDLTNSTAERIRSLRTKLKPTTNERSLHHYDSEFDPKEIRSAARSFAAYTTIGADFWTFKEFMDMQHLEAATQDLYHLRAAADDTGAEHAQHHDEHPQEDRRLQDSGLGQHSIQVADGIGQWPTQQLREG